MSRVCAAASTTAYLSRLTRLCRHSIADLRIHLTWCTQRGQNAVQARRADLELYVRRLQETRRFEPSTRLPAHFGVAGYYRTCLTDGILQHSPAEHLRGPTVPPESPTLGLTHLQFEGHAHRRTAPTERQRLRPGRDARPPGLRIFEATDITDLREEHGHPSCASSARAPGSCSPRFRGEHGPIRRNGRGAHLGPARRDRGLRHLAGAAGVRLARMHAQIVRHLRHHHARRRRRPARRANRRTTRQPWTGLP
jgi:integrase/recombinase XerD